MKKVIAITMLSLAAIAGASTAMAREGGNGGGSPINEPFTGDVDKATPREQLSTQYKTAKAMKAYREKKAAETAQSQATTTAK